MSLIIVCVLISVVCLVIVITPFFVGKGGRLAHTSSINDLKQLEAMRGRIVERFVVEEKAHNDGQLAKMTWGKRQEFLGNRYIDVCRRIDFLTKLGNQS